MCIVFLMMFGNLGSLLRFTEISIEKYRKNIKPTLPSSSKRRIMGSGHSSSSIVIDKNSKEDETQNTLLIEFLTSEFKEEKEIRFLHLNMRHLIKLPPQIWTDFNIFNSLLTISLNSNKLKVRFSVRHSNNLC